MTAYYLTGEVCRKQRLFFLLQLGKEGKLLNTALLELVKHSREIMFFHQLSPIL